MKQMKRIFGCTLAAMLASTAMLAAACSSETADMDAPAFKTPDVTLEADGDQATAISDELFGVFLEDINFASYVLDDNVLANGGFSYGTEPSRWTLNGAEGYIGDTDGIPGNPSYLQLRVLKEGACLENGGYLMAPIATAEGVPLNFSAFFRAHSYEGDVRLELVKGDTVLGSSQISVERGDDWVKYTSSITPEISADEGVSFRLTFAQPGELDLDGVALETSDSTAGVKNYVYRAIEDLSPAFVRFPGGCVIEGKGDESAYDWKNSIGVNGQDEVPVFTYTESDGRGGKKEMRTRGEWVTRQPNVDIWQTAVADYQMDYSIGFYEYFMLCDSLGASAIPIVNCGLSCMIQTGGYGKFNRLSGRYGNGIDDFIQDALDLVAFAKGSVSSQDENEKYWAQLRSDMGHPEPFDMEYLGIGNEQFGNDYYSAYEQFAEAFRKAGETNSLYRSVRLIVGNNVNIQSCEGYNGGKGEALPRMESYRSAGKIANVSEYGVVDHHYYLNYIDFLTRHDFYDGYSRDAATRYDVFVGEYSANGASDLSNKNYGNEKNTWIAALSEAAYMTGLERNGDVVKLAAYAPMFGSTEARFNQWAVDMMYYTNTRLLLTPNYYVQQAFMKNSCTQYLATERTDGTEFEATVEMRPATGAGFTEVQKLYQVIGRDERTGDVIVKLVNVSDSAVNVNVKLKGVKVKGVADVVLLQGESIGAVNTLKQTSVQPETFTLGAKAEFGYAAPAYSLTVIRLHG